MRLRLKNEEFFPNLNGENYRVTSDSSPDYNCIAYAAGVDNAYWWPVDGIDGVTWPAGVEREETLECFAALYALQGYVPCRDARLEEGFEKVAIYVDTAGEPTHAAKQLLSGAWTSKLGDREDIEHDTLFALEDDSEDAMYGEVALIMKRERR